jgi:hypothetical protein
MACNFQIGSNKMELHTEYDIMTQKVPLFIDSILHNAKQLQHEPLSWHVSGLKIIGHGITDINLESH